MKILMLFFRSKKSFDEMIKLSETREDLYKTVPGLLQIVYMKDERTNQAGSILFFILTTVILFIRGRLETLKNEVV